MCDTCIIEYAVMLSSNRHVFVQILILGKAHMQHVFEGQWAWAVNNIVMIPVVDPVVVTY